MKAGKNHRSMTLGRNKAAGRMPAPQVATAKPGFVDRLIHAGYTAAGSAMATFEKSAGKLPKSTVL